MKKGEKGGEKEGEKQRVNQYLDLETQPVRRLAGGTLKFLFGSGYLQQALASWAFELKRAPFHCSMSLLKNNFSVASLRVKAFLLFLTPREVILWQCPI